MSGRVGVLVVRFGEPVECSVSCAVTSAAVETQNVAMVAMSEPTRPRPRTIKM